MVGDPLCPRDKVPLDYQAVRGIDSRVVLLYASCPVCKQATDAVPMPRELNMEKLTAVIREGA